MPGFSNADNKFGLSPYIVGTVLGDGCSYTSIQTAIDDAFAAGAGTVYVRNSPTPYIENLTLRSNVQLLGCCVDGRIPTSVEIQGNHTFNGAAPGNNVFTIDNINFSVAAGDIFTMSPTAGVVVILAMKFCNIQAPGGSCVLISGAGGFSVFTAENCEFDSLNRTFFGTSGTGTLLLNDCSASASATPCIEFSVPMDAELERCVLRGDINCIVNNGGSINVSYSQMLSSEEVILMGAASPVISYYNTYNSNAVSGFYISGVAGSSYVYCNDVMVGTSLDIDPTITQTKQLSRPTAESGASPGTGVAKGTASFNSTHFGVSDGFVSLNAAVATSFNADSGTAIPSGGNLQILTGSHITSAASGNQVLITLDGSVPTDWQMDGATMTQSVGGLMKLIGGAGIKTFGNGINTITISGVEYTDTAVSLTAAGDEGYFATGGGAVTITTEPGAAQGESLEVFRVGATGLVIMAQAGQTIQIGTGISSSGGTATSSASGDSLTLVFNVVLSRWFAKSVIGTWALA